MNRAYLYSLSIEYLAMLDKWGIKIIGIEFEHSDNDTDWVN